MECVDAELVLQEMRAVESSYGVRFLGADERISEHIESDAAILAKIGRSSEGIAFALCAVLEHAAARVWGKSTLRLLEELKNEGWEPDTLEACFGFKDTEHAESLFRALRRLDLGERYKFEERLVIPDRVASFTEFINARRVTVGGKRALMKCPWGCSIEPGSLSPEKGALETLIEFENGNYESVSFKEYKAVAWMDFRVTDLECRESVAGHGLAAHLIGTHGFFGGVGAPYRIEPAALVRVLGLA